MRNSKPLKLKPSLDWLLIFVPIAILLRFWPGGISPTALFVCSALGIVPVAGWIGRATEALASRVGEGLGGLLNATFGNAAELIIGGIALSKGLTNVVKASITGSIIGNVLLVLGLSILFGGTKYKEQRFNRTAVTTSVASLSLAAIGLVIPTVFHRAVDRTAGGWSALVEQKLSLAIAVVLFLTDFCMLGFSLWTHKHFFQGVHRHADLTIPDLSQRPRVLAGDPDRHLPELRKPRVIDHPHLRRQLTAHPPRQRATHRRHIPRRLIDELLQTLLITVSQPSRHRLDRLARQRRQQLLQRTETPCFSAFRPRCQPRRQSATKDKSASFLAAVA